MRKVNTLIESADDDIGSGRDPEIESDSSPVGRPVHELEHY